MRLSKLMAAVGAGAHFSFVSSLLRPTQGRSYHRGLRSELRAFAQNDQ